MKTGDIAPNFNLKNQNGNDFDLYKNLTKKILLVFYPKDDTPVCSKQLNEYNQNLNLFNENKISLIGISSNSVESHLKFSSQLSLKFPLLSDSDKSVSRQYNAINILGLGKRKLVLVDTDKTVIWINDMLPITYQKAVEILNDLKALAL